MTEPREEKSIWEKSGSKHTLKQVANRGNRYLCLYDDLLMVRAMTVGMNWP